MKNILLSIVIVFGLMGIARADIFGPPVQPKYEAVKASNGSLITIEPATIFEDIANIVDYLGSREGTVYDFHQKQWETYSGATFYTWKGFSADIGMLNVSGVGLSIDYNLGAFLPTKGIPILQYTQYLYVGGGCGGYFDSTKNAWEIAPFAGAQFKLTF